MKKLEINDGIFKLIHAVKMLLMGNRKYAKELTQRGILINLIYELKIKFIEFKNKTGRTHRAYKYFLTLLKK